MVARRRPCKSRRRRRRPPPRGAPLTPYRGRPSALRPSRPVLYERSNTVRAASAPPSAIAHATPRRRGVAVAPAVTSRPPLSCLSPASLRPGAGGGAGLCPRCGPAAELRSRLVAVERQHYFKVLLRRALGARGDLNINGWMETGERVERVRAFIQNVRHPHSPPRPCPPLCPPLAPDTEPSAPGVGSCARGNRPHLPWYEKKSRTLNRKYCQYCTL